MPRIGRVYKKKKAFGWHLTNENRPNLNSVSSPSTSNVETSSVVSKPSSTSKLKLDKHTSEYNEFENSSFQYDIIDLDSVKSLITEVAVCKVCHGSLTLSTSKRVGLACTLSLNCLHCDVTASKTNSPMTEVSIDRPNENKMYKVYDVNIRFVYAMRSIGVGQETAEIFAGLMNFNKPSKFMFYNKLLLSAVQRVCTESMKEAVENSVKQNDGIRDIAAAFDGSWQRRGYSSLNGVVTATSITTGEVIDVEIFSKFCQCKERLQKIHVDNCIANYSGTSGGMEVEGVQRIFRRSKLNYDVRYAYYLGDGDCKGYDTVCADQPYGPNFKIEKMECVGHIQKRMGTRLRSYKKSNPKKILSDGKKIGGIGRLSNAAIDTLQLYYGLAIRRNASKGVQAMRQAIWAEYFHMGSTDQNPQHNLCPSSEDTWCKYQIAKKKNEAYKHEEHTHLPMAVLEEIKPIFRDLSNPVLLAKCAHGGTQNVSESLNNIIWSRIPKKIFVRINTLKLGVYDAIASYNKGFVSKCITYKLLGLQPGYNCIKSMKSLDERRVKKADKAIQEIEKKCREATRLKRKHLEDEFEQDEDPDNPAYAPGHY